MPTRLYSHPIFLEHLVPPGHPERPDRLRAIDRALEHEGFDRLERVEAVAAQPDAVLLVHPESHFEAIARQVPQEGLAAVDGDTMLSPKSLEAAMFAVGAATAAVDDVFLGRADNVFVAARPPGHHAERSTAMGFCLFNNAAIAARHAQRTHGAERIAIVDWDVHHGNGTQEIFWDDRNILYCSTHQMPLFPGTGARNETGAGNIVNAPLSDGDGSAAFRDAFASRIVPEIENFRPDLIIVSAGFDAHWRDPLAGLRLDTDDFDWATGRLLELSGKHCGYRLISLLEGGYDLQGLAASVGVHVARLMRG